MPIYEYHCPHCGEIFSHLWTTISAASAAAEQGQVPACPHCHHAHTQRVVSRVTVLGSMGGLTPDEQASRKAQEERRASFTPRETIDRLQANRDKKQ
jgi:putative FmdB family regulatory protein